MLYHLFLCKHALPSVLNMPLFLFILCIFLKKLFVYLVCDIWDCKYSLLEPPPSYKHHAVLSCGILFGQGCLMLVIGKVQCFILCNHMHTTVSIVIVWTCYKWSNLYCKYLVLKQWPSLPHPAKNWLLFLFSPGSVWICWCFNVWINCQGHIRRPCFISFLFFIHLPKVGNKSLVWRFSVPVWLGLFLVLVFWAYQQAEC